jgi:hypothetical protein
MGLEKKKVGFPMRSRGRKAADREGKKTRQPGRKGDQ